MGCSLGCGSHDVEDTLRITQERLKAAEERLAWSEQERKLLLEKLVASLEQRAHDQAHEKDHLQKQRDAQDETATKEAKETLKQVETVRDQSEEERKQILERLLRSVQIASISAERSRGLAEDRLWQMEDGSIFNINSCCTPNMRSSRLRQLSSDRIMEIGEANGPGMIALLDNGVNGQNGSPFRSNVASHSGVTPPKKKDELELFF